MGRDAWEERNDWKVCRRGVEKSPWVGPQVQGAEAKDQVNEEEGGYLKKKMEDYIRVKLLERGWMLEEVFC